MLCSQTLRYAYEDRSSPAGSTPYHLHSKNGRPCHRQLDAIMYYPWVPPPLLSAPLPGAVTILHVSSILEAITLLWPGHSRGSA